MIEFLGDKWSFLILRDLVVRGKRYYGEFLNSEEQISTNILADRLEKLEQEGFVTKAKDQNHGSKFIYTPTQKAIDTIPIMLQMIVWSHKYDSDTFATEAFVDRVKGDPEQMRADLEELTRAGKSWH